MLIPSPVAHVKPPALEVAARMAHVSVIGGAPPGMLEHCSMKLTSSRQVPGASGVL